MQAASVVQPHQVNRARRGALFSRHLHSLFIAYIKAERRRAPAESELEELRTTFQVNARCDRRAVQGKFKSWSRRMSIDSCGTLFLNQTRIIVPKENFIPILLLIHLNNGNAEHCGINEIAQKYQHVYTWGQLDYGAEWEHIICALHMCPRPECRRHAVEADEFLELGTTRFIEEASLTSDSTSEWLVKSMRETTFQLYGNSLLPVELSNDEKLISKLHQNIKVPMTTTETNALQKAMQMVIQTRDQQRERNFKQKTGRPLKTPPSVTGAIVDNNAAENSENASETSDSEVDLESLKLLEHLQQTADEKDYLRMDRFVGEVRRIRQFFPIRGRPTQARCDFLRARLEALSKEASRMKYRLFLIEEAH